MHAVGHLCERAYGPSNLDPVSLVVSSGKFLTAKNFIQKQCSVFHSANVRTPIGLFSL